MKTHASSIATLFAVASIVITSSLVKAETSATVKPWGTAVYNKGESGKDMLTVEGDVVITDQSSYPALVGEVIISGKTVTWKGREADQGVFYTVRGYIATTGGTGSGPGTAKKNIFESYYDYQGGPRVVVTPIVQGINGNDQLRLGQEGAPLVNDPALRVRLVGAPNDSYQVTVTLTGIILLEQKDGETVLLRDPLCLVDGSGNDANSVQFTMTRNQVVELKVKAKDFGEEEIAAEAVDAQDAEVPANNVTLVVSPYREGRYEEGAYEISPPSGIIDYGNNQIEIFVESNSYKCRYGAVQALRARDIEDVDSDPATQESLYDSVADPDAILWRCTRTDGQYTGHVFPVFGAHTVFYALPATVDGDPNPITKADVILDIKDDAKYAKDTSSQGGEVPASERRFIDRYANTGSAPPGQGVPGVDVSELKYYQVACLPNIHYFAPPTVGEIHIIDAATPARKHERRLEIVGDTSASSVKVRIKLSAGEWGGGVDQYPAVTQLSGLTKVAVTQDPEDETVRTIELSAPAYSLADATVEDILNGTVRKYPVTIDAASGDGDPIQNVELWVFPKGGASITLQDDFTQPVQKLSADLGTFEASYENKVPDGQTAPSLQEPQQANSISFSCSWEERLSEDPLRHEVLFACSAACPIKTIFEHEVEIPLKTPVHLVNVVLGFGGKVKVGGQIGRRPADPSGYGELNLKATIGGKAGVELDLWVLEAEAGVETSLTGLVYLKANVVGLALGGKIDWDGVGIYGQLQKKNIWGEVEDEWKVSIPIISARTVWPSDGSTAEAYIYTW